MTNTKVGITVKKVEGKKPSLEDMYLIDEPAKTESRLEELKQDLQDAGYDLSEFTRGELVRMLERGL